MTTKNIVPRTGSDNGQIGTTSKHWSKGHFDEITASVGVSASYLYGDGSNLTGIATGTPTLDEVTTAGNTTANNITIGQVSASYLSASSDIRVAGNSHFGSELTDTHIFTGSFHQTGSGATSIFKDRIRIMDSGLEVFTDGETLNDKVSFTTYDFEISDQLEELVYRIANNGEHTFYNNNSTRFTINGNGASTTQNITASGHMSASVFYGDGSGLTGVTGDWDGQHNGAAGITGSLEIQSADGIEVKRGDGVTLGNLEQFGPSGFKISSADPLLISGSTGTYISSGGNLQLETANNSSITAVGNHTANVTGYNRSTAASHQFTGSTQVLGDISASLGITGSAVHADSAYITDLWGSLIRATNGNIEASLSPGTVSIYNDLSVGIHADPDVFVAERQGVVNVGDKQGKVGVRYNIADLPDAHFSVSGSTKLGDRAADLLQVTGTVEVLGDISASVNISASTFYGDLDVAAAGGAALYPIMGEGHLAGTKAPKFKTSFFFTPAFNRVSAGQFQTSTTGYFIAQDNASSPATPVGSALMYAITGSMYVQDTAGTETKISPHDEQGEWEYFSRNTNTGKVVRIKMEKMIRKLEELTGETFIEEE